MELMLDYVFVYKAIRTYIGFGELGYGLWAGYLEVVFGTDIE
jgi:hypothetical protein